MNYTPNDIQNLTFKRSLRGFDEDMVNDVLDKIIEDYSFYIHENIELKDRVGVLNEGIQHYKSMEDSLQETLVIAQQTSEEIKRNAQDRAELIVREAEMRAQTLINEASKDSTKVKYEYEDIKNKMQMFRLRNESLLTSQLEMLKQMFKEDEAPVKEVREEVKIIAEEPKIEVKEEIKEEIKEETKRREKIKDRTAMKVETKAEIKEEAEFELEPEEKPVKTKTVSSSNGGESSSRSAEKRAANEEAEDFTTKPAPAKMSKFGFSIGNQTAKKTSAISIKLAADRKSVV